MPRTESVLMLPLPLLQPDDTLCLDFDCDGYVAVQLRLPENQTGMQVHPV